MTKYIFSLILSLLFIRSYSQSQQTIIFRVNAYYIKGIHEELTPLCEGFNVIITTDFIDIGDAFKLKIISKTINKENGSEVYMVDDPAKARKVRYAIVGNDKSFIALFAADEKGKKLDQGGFVFQFWDYVSNYDLWRYNRNKMK